MKEKAVGLEFVHGMSSLNLNELTVRFNKHATSLMTLKCSHLSEKPFKAISCIKINSFMRIRSTENYLLGVLLIVPILKP